MEHLNIYPQVKPKEFIEKNTQNLVYNTAFPNLYSCYIETNEATITYITEIRLKELNLDKDSLNRIALSNLNNLENSQNGTHLMNNGDETNSLSYETGDTYDAARILLLSNPKYLDYFISILGDPFIVAVPFRDFLLAAPASYENKLAGYAKQLFLEKSNPITPELFMFSKNPETFTK